MRTYDLSPLFRSTVGFDRFDRLFDSALRMADTAPSFPPYNIERNGENAYRITMAVAGFSRDELDVTLEKGVLTVRGRSLTDQADQADEASEDADRQILYRGIAKRAFERRFQLDDTIRVVGADLDHGLLSIDLVREVPEHAKPRQIEIGTRAIEANPTAH